MALQYQLIAVKMNTSFGFCNKTWQSLRVTLYFALQLSTPSLQEMTSTKCNNKLSLSKSMLAKSLLALIHLKLKKMLTISKHHLKQETVKCHSGGRNRKMSLWWQLCPINGSFPPFFEQHVALGEVLAAKETTVNWQRRWVDSLQHMVLLLHGTRRTTLKNKFCQLKIVIRNLQNTALQCTTPLPQSWNFTFCLLTSVSQWISDWKKQQQQKKTRK